MDQTITIVVVAAAAVGAILAGFILRKAVYVVKENEAIVIERLGKFKKVMTPGINFIFPLFDNPRTFLWRSTRVDINGKITDDTSNGFVIDLRESVFNFLPQEVFSKDTVYIDVCVVMYYKIVDVQAAVYEVDDLLSSLTSTATSAVKEVFSNLTFTQALESQRQICEHLTEEFRRAFKGWGIHVERVELLDLQPTANTKEAMRNQMIAEKRRRCDFIRSEGQKTALRLKAEGNKLVKLNRGIAEQEATRKISEGEAAARIDLARAESAALESLASAVRTDGASNIDYVVSQRYMEFLKAASTASGGKTIVLPYESNGIKGTVDVLPQVYGNIDTAKAKKRRVHL